MTRYMVVWVGGGTHHFRSFDAEADARAYYNDLEMGVTKFLVLTEEQNYAALIGASRSCT